MKSPPQADFSKLQVVASLFVGTFGGDLFYARQIKESIEAALPPEKRDDIETFIDYAKQLATQMASDPDAVGIGLVPVIEAHGFSILSLRARLLEALKQTCRFKYPLVVLTGLKEAICPIGKRWTPRRKKEYEDAIAFTRDFCHARSRPSAKLSLVIF